VTIYTSSRHLNFDDREKSIPSPFNDNDVTIWNALVCKYLCQKQNSGFNESEFLGAVIDDKILPLGAYDKVVMRKTRAQGNGLPCSVICFEPDNINTSPTIFSSSMNIRSSSIL
jgi:hypothetical protein